ncbi:MAG: type IV secretion system protein [Halarcobacter ebronensis]|uniref:type IV secretion system protein n=1 Tax=Halarcobacter ebronensis TaxID=1462615 RepID=UPI003C78C432
MNDVSLRFAEKIAAIFTKTIELLFAKVHTMTTEIMQPFFMPVLTLYFIIIGWQVIIGNLSSKKDSLIRLFILFPLISSAIFNLETYNEFVSTPIINLKDFITSKISSLTGNENIFTWLDTIFIKLFTEVSATLWNGNFLFNIANYVFGFLLVAVYFILYLFATIFTLESLVAVYLLLLIGPIFIIFFAFNETKFITSAWFKSLMTYWLYAPFTALIILFAQGVVSVATKESVGNVFGMLFTLFAGALCVYFIKKVPEYANSITMGVSNSGVAFSWSNLRSVVPNRNKNNNKQK